MIALNLYKTEIEPSKNMMVDFIGLYLRELPQSDKLSISKVQYIKPEMNITIDLDLSQNILTQLDLFPYNYLSISEGTGGASITPFYYFIMDYEWRSTSTIRLICTLDTLNTFRTKYINNFTDKTTIHREHEDRFDEHTKFRKIDRQDEGITPIQYTTLLREVRDKDLDFKWYLLYRNRENISPTDLENPLECYICPEKDLKLEDGKVVATKEVSLLPPGIGEQYIFSTQTNYYPSITVLGTFLNPSTNIKLTTNANTLYVIVYNDTLGDQTVLYNIYKGTINSDGVVSYTLAVDRAKRWRYDAINYATEIKTGASKDKKPSTVSIREIEENARHFINAGQLPDKLLYKFKDIDRTDPKINKIIELPYAPLNFRIENGIFKYSLRDLKVVDLLGSNALKLIDLDVKFEHLIKPLRNVINFNEFKVDLPTTGAQADITLKDIKYESKMYNSAFYSKEVHYDEFTYQFPLELLDPEEIQADGYMDNFEPKFIVTSTMNSNMLFDFSDIYVNDSLAYPGVMIARRNNEPIVYNTPYVNYIKNGYNYDKKRMDLGFGYNMAAGLVQLAPSVLAAGVGFGGGMANAWSALSIPQMSRVEGLLNSGDLVGRDFSYNRFRDVASSFGAGAKGAVNQVGVASQLNFGRGIGTIASAIVNKLQAEQTMQQRLNDLKNSKINVAGSDDLDLFDYFSNNKLKVQHKDIEALMKESIWDLFFYCGYKHEVQDLPKLDTRRWFNFIQCDPVFNKEVSKIRNVYLTDIKQRFAAGVTIFHRVNDKYDFEQKLENFETWLYK